MLLVCYFKLCKLVCHNLQVLDSKSYEHPSILKKKFIAVRLAFNGHHKTYSMQHLARYMLTPEEIRAIDRSSICSAYNSWPTYCRDAFSRNMDVDEKLFGNVSSIVFSGMGGSGTTGDIIADWMRLKCDIPIHVVKGYHIPAFVNERTLFIAMSVSGDTEETLTSLMEAVSVGATVIGVSHGGEMEQICKKKGIFHLEVEQRIMPRVTLPYVLYSILKLLTHSRFLDGLRDQIDDSIRTMEQIGRKISSDCIYEENPAKQLAPWLLDHIPVAYCSPLQRGIGIRFKNSVNENAKVNAATAEILDSCHNELMAWGSREGTSLKPVLVRNLLDSNEISMRFDVFKEILQKNGHEVYEIPMHGSTALSSIVSSLYLLDYVTIYLAILRKVDPAPVEPIVELKGSMKERLDYFAKFVKPRYSDK